VRRKLPRLSATRYGKYTGVEYARFADDLVILIDAHQRHDWLMAAVEKRLREELVELQVDINEEKSRIVAPESRSGRIGPISLGAKQAGERSARKSARCVVCPEKAGVFSRSQSCRGRSQSPVVWIAEERETELSKPIDKASLGEVTSHRAVIKVNALWPRKCVFPRAEPST